MMMADSLITDLLTLAKSGSIVVYEDNKESIQVNIKNSIITMELCDVTSRVPNLGNVFLKITQARNFAKQLQEKDLTLCIRHRGKIVIKLGKNANPTISQMITLSKAVEITNLVELRRLDIRLRKR